MGEVYRAFDANLRRKVALKVLHPDLAVPDAAARMVREARAAAALAHPNTIAIHDLGEIDGTVFIVMELVSGASLRAYVGDTTVPVAQKLRWLVDVARGLGAAHKAGLVHRDVKPTNVMVSDDGVVKVLDFGLAKPLEAASFDSDVGLVVGTPRYMAPELFSGIAADARSDQYAFGVTAYELLSGVHPGSPVGPVPAALDTLVPEVGPAAARVIARTLSRAPADRFASMNEVVSALDSQITGALVTSGPAQPSPPTRREGPPAPGAAALALAPTELQPSASGATLASRAAAATDAADPSHARARSGSKVVPIVAVLTLLVGGGYGAMRFLGAGAEPAATPSPPSSSSLEASTTDGAATAAVDALDGEAAAPAPLATAPEMDAASDAPEDASAAADAAPDGARRPISHEEFEDPWLKHTR